MELFLIPQVDEIKYLDGATRCDAPINKKMVYSFVKEEYSLLINGDITVYAGSDAGFFYAEKTLEQIRAQCGQNLPNVFIKDSPRYHYRSFMIDSCRHYFSVDGIKRMIAHCAKLKLNVFHWHLTDDQGWRPEIKAFPALVAVGSKRYGNHFGEEQNENLHAGYYTREQMLEIVDFAHEHHMIVVPEIDMPGHVSALLSSIPELACNGKKVEIKTTPGIFKDILCAGNEKNYDVLFRILDEICEIFPDKYIHIGGDEAPKAQWKSCPDCQKKIKEEYLADEEALQGYFINRVQQYLSGKGKKVITWNESLNSGNLSKDVIVQMWMDPKGMSKKSPNRIINSDFYHYYADYPYAMTPLKKVYDYEPQINENVFGTDIPIWTEYIQDIRKMEYMCFPRFMAAAQTAWSKNKPSYAQFKTSIQELERYFDIKNMAKKEDWDPKKSTRPFAVLAHFGKINPNENIRKLFTKRK